MRLVARVARTLACAAAWCVILATLDGTAAAAASGWSSQPVFKNAFLTGVSCTSPKACVAVGNSLGGSALVERWNGVRWSVQPNPAGSRPGGLSGVSCTSTTACTAVGSLDAGNGAPLVERWDGASWSIQPTQKVAGDGFSGVSCSSKAFCAAVGTLGGVLNQAPLLGSWNGHAWSLDRSFFGLNGGASGVSCVSPTSCTGVGDYLTSFGSGVAAGFQGVRWDWNGRRWSQFAFQPYVSAAQVQLNAVSCISRVTCIAVGQGAAVRLTGSGLSPLPTVKPRTAVDYELLGVSCTSRTACIAVGDYDTTHSPPLSQTHHVLVERWDGSSWSVEQTELLGTLDGVSCVSPTACTAVGTAIDRAGERVGLVESTIVSARGLRARRSAAWVVASAPA